MDFLFRKILSKRWLTPEILVTWEAEIRRIAVQGQPGEIALMSPSQPTARLHGGKHLSSQPTVGSMH
jgi:hypothetical protein